MTPTLPSSVHTDHPRSRGVYQGDEFAHDVECGSSPLARGLPRRRHITAVQTRIIPARAGFTNGCTDRRSTCQDHPRSRGVYSTTGSTPPGTSGSSPLARGLRGAIPSVRRGSRIIPARAGFTASVWACTRAVRDHPRSRGVYGRRQHVRQSHRGSSPLARGLPVHLIGGLGVKGIIPARAGFTSGW